jgi:small subunit ribosomal protein S14
MARAVQWAKVNRPPKFSTACVNRCKVCGRPRAFTATSACAACAPPARAQGELPGVTKASW